MATEYRTDYPEIEAYMQSCMTDSAHDREHVYRVLNYAYDIARYEIGVDMAALSAACLLHDVGRAEQFADPSVDHALCGSEKAYVWLVRNGYSDSFAAAVKSCIRTHRYRSDSKPQSIEAMILFDADKIEVCGAMGIARTLFYNAYLNEPLYSLTEDGEVSDGANDSEPSFFQEYKFKLENIYKNFYTKRGAELAQKRKQAARDYYTALLSEALECYSVPLKNNPVKVFAPHLKD